MGGGDFGATGEGDFKMSTRADRQKLCTELSKKFDRWRGLTDENLLAEVRSLMPSILSASREECVKFLTIDHVAKMVS
jgi:hypothetical protein